MKNLTNPNISIPERADRADVTVIGGALEGLHGAITDVKKNMASFSLIKSMPSVAGTVIFQDQLVAGNLYLLFVGGISSASSTGAYIITYTAGIANYGTLFPPSNNSHTLTLTSSGDLTFSCQYSAMVRLYRI